MMHGLAISFPENALVQSPLRLSACANMYIHTRLRVGSDARLAATRGSGRYSRWTRYQHGCGSYCRTSATRELVQTRMSKCGGSSDDMALTSPTRGTRGWLSDSACLHLLHRVPSRRSSGLLVSQCQGSRFVARDGRARSGACMHGVWHVLAIHRYVSLPNCLWKESRTECILIQVER